MDCVYSAAEWPIDDLVPDPNQPRKRFEGLEELAATIKANRIIQPIIATPHLTAPASERS